MGLRGRLGIGSPEMYLAANGVTTTTTGCGHRFLKNKVYFSVCVNEQNVKVTEYIGIYRFEKRFQA